MRCLLYLVLLMCCLQVLAQNNTANGGKVIYLLSLLPYYNPQHGLNPSWPEGGNIQPALELAQDQINNSSLLQDYRLQMVYSESGCDIVPITTVGFVMEAFDPDRDRLTGVIGPGCSVSAESYSSLMTRAASGLVTIHGAGSPLLSNRTIHKYLLGTLGSTKSFVKGLLLLLRHTRWKRLAVLYDNSRLFYQHILRELLAELNEFEGVKAEFLSPVSSAFIPLQAVRQQHVRPILVLCPAGLSRKIICLSFNSGLIYPNYQWVFVRHELDDLLQPMDFVYENTRYNCSEDNMAAALEMSTLVPYNLRPASDDAILVSNTSYDQYSKLYQQYRELYNARASRPRNASYTFWATFLYDSVWAWALVLDNLTRSDSTFEIGTEYGNFEQSDLILEQFYRTHFSGMSGEISFDNTTGYIQRAVNLFQISNSTPFLVGSSDSNSSLTNFMYISDSFPNSVRASYILGSISLMTVSALVLITMFLHFLTVVYHKKPSVKASSPYLLHISYIGIYIVSIGFWLNSLYSAAALDTKWRHYFCQLMWGWSFPLGFIISFSPVAMRAWKLYRIYEHYLSPGPLISNPVLIGGIIALLAPLLIISIVWMAIDSFQGVVIFDDDAPVGELVRVRVSCYCNHYLIWMVIIFTYCTAVLLVVSIFSLLTRNISNRTFDTNALRVLSYVMTILFLLGFSLFFLLSAINFNPDYGLAVLTIQINLMIAIFIVCVFMPPLAPILRAYRSNVQQKGRKTSVASNTNICSRQLYMASRLSW